MSDPPRNMYSTTTRVHQEPAGGTFRAVVVDEVHDPCSRRPFGGDAAPGKPEAWIVEAGGNRTRARFEPVDA